MSGPSREKPLTPKQQSGIAPTSCRACHAPFDVMTLWPRSKWTLSGFSPWCVECHALHAPKKERRAKSGPKPKGVKGGWTNLPIV